MYKGILTLISVVFKSPKFILELFRGYRGELGDRSQLVLMLAFPAQNIRNVILMCFAC